jgi:hypothetical protein
VYKIIGDRLDSGPIGYLKNSYENLLAYYQNTPWIKDINKFREETKIRDTRRDTDCKKVFHKLFEELDAETLD